MSSVSGPLSSNASEPQLNSGKEKQAASLPVKPQGLPETSKKDLQAETRKDTDTSEMEVQEVVRQIDPPGLLKGSHHEESSKNLLLNADKAKQWVEELGLTRLSRKDHTAFRKGLSKLLDSIREGVFRLFSAGKTRPQLMDRFLEEFFKQSLVLTKNVSSQEKNKLMINLVKELHEIFNEQMKGRDPAQLESFIKDFEEGAKQLLLKQNSENPDFFIVCTNCVLDAVQKGIKPPLFQFDETFSFENMIPTLTCNRYIYSTEEQETVRLAQWNEPLETHEMEFNAIHKLEADIFRDPAYVNGHRCSTLGELISKLLAIGVPNDKVGEMASLFAQNTFNMMNAISMARFQNTPMPSIRTKSLHYDPETLSFSFKAEMFVNSLCFNKEQVFAGTEDKNYDRFYKGDWELKGTFAENQSTSVKSHFEWKELLGLESTPIDTPLPPVNTPSIDSIEAFNNGVNLRIKALSPYEEEALRQYGILHGVPLMQLLKDLKNIERLTQEMEACVNSIPGVKRDSLSGEPIMPQDLLGREYLSAKAALAQYRLKKADRSELQKKLHQDAVQVFPEMRKARYEQLVRYIKEEEQDYEEFQVWLSEIQDVRIEDLSSEEASAKIKNARDFLATLPPQV